MLKKWFVSCTKNCDNDCTKSYANFAYTSTDKRFVVCGKKEVADFVSFKKKKMTILTKFFREIFQNAKIMDFVFL